MNHLFIRLGEPAVQTETDQWALTGLSWVLLDSDGALISQGHGDGDALGRLLERRGLDEATSVVLLVPTEHAMLLELTVPGRSAGQMRRALPFVLEEYLATEIDDMHLAYGPLQRGEPIRCVSVDRSLVAHWLDALNYLDLRAVAMVPEAGLLPEEDGTINVLFDEQDVLVAGAAQAAVIDPELLVMALSSAVGELNATGGCVIRTINGQVSDLDRSQVEQHFDGTINWVDEDTEVPALVYLARRWLANPTPLNLLHGEFAPPREIDPDWLKLRPVAALLGIWFVLSILLQLGTAGWADYRAGGLEATTEELYREYFPADQRVVDPYRQMAQRIGQSDAEGVSFIDLLGHLGAELGDAGSASMRSVAYNAGRSELSAQLIVAQFDALDALKDALAQRGLEVEIVTAEQQEDGIHARLRLKGA